MKYSGKLITFEGGEGGGKSLQIDKLEKYLSGKGYTVVRTREPGGVEISEKIRNLLLNPEIDKLERNTEIFLFSAARVEFCKRFLEPHLNEGNIVISDRFYDSTTAYQGYGWNADAKTIDFIKRNNNIASRGIVPDITFVIDIDPVVGLEKVVTSEFGKKDRIESKPLSYHTNVRNGFLKIAEEEPGRVKVISYVNGEAEKMHKEIVGHADIILNKND